jgi:UDP-N-acetylglucosamine 2-epimerase (non-hydrolysing)
MKRIALIAGLVLAAFSIALAGNITIKGSDTLVRLGQKWAEEYMKRNPGSVIQVSGGGSGTGIAALINGTTDVCQSSRPMKEKEYKTAQDKGITPHEVAVALDGIAVFLNEKNPVAELTLAQLKGIYTGVITNWKELGGPDQRIFLCRLLYVPQSDGKVPQRWGLYLTMKIMTVLGTRPEIIRLSRVIEKLDKQCNHVLVHTGQNYESTLNDIFFHDLNVRDPDYYLGIKADSFAEQIGKILVETEKAFIKERPDKILILGDTNSGLSCITARRMGIPVFHMEAGNRCYDDRVPEEINRRIIDHTSNILMPYTHNSKGNLLAEGIKRDCIHVTGNPIYEVILHYAKKIDESKALENLKLKPQSYFLVTAHRAENVDDKERLNSLLTAFEKINKKYGLPLICSLHPRTKNKMNQFGFCISNKNIRLLEPFGFFDFISLEKQARCIITDSGTVQEEACILKVPNITIRDTTERPETIECGSNVLTGVSPEVIMKTLEVVLEKKPDWTPPAEYLVKNVSSRVVKIVLE